MALPAGLPVLTHDTTRNPYSSIENRTLLTPLLEEIEGCWIVILKDIKEEMMTQMMEE